MNLVDAIERQIDDFNHRKNRECGKIKYFTPAAAKKALRDHGYSIGCRQWYECPHHEGAPIYHITKRRRFIRKP